MSSSFLLDQRAGWRGTALDKTTLADDGAQLRLQELPGSARPLVDAMGSLGGLVYPLGLAVDSDGKVYVLDGAANVVRRFDPCTQSFEVVPCIAGSGSEPRQVRQPQGIAISTRDDLYLVDSGNRRIQIFALKGLPLRDIWEPLRVIRTGNDITVKRTTAVLGKVSDSGDCDNPLAFPDGTWQPWDIALAGDGRAFVSDYANGLIHVLNGYGRWLKAFSGEDGGQPALVKPTRLALDRDCNLYVLQEGKDYVTVYDADGHWKSQLGSDDANGLADKFCPVEIAVDADGNIYISDKLGRCVRVFCPDPQGCPQYVGTCGGFEGVGLALAFDKAGNPLTCDPEKPRVVCFAPPAAYPMKGTFQTDAMDSNKYRCQWHRVLLCADIPAGTELLVETFTSEAYKSADEVAGLGADRWATGILDTQTGEGEWDCLIASPPGRYLWLRLTLRGDGTATPTLRWVRIYYPRISSLQYLPATYSEDPISRNFLDRFLAIYDTIRDSLAESISTMARIFDPAATPAGTTHAGEIDFLTWLAGWLDLTLDRHWAVEKQRALVKQAYKLYRLRGTPEGLRLHLMLYTGIEPRLLEHFKVRRWTLVDHARLGDDTVVWGKEVIKRLQLDGDAQIGSFQLVDTGDPLRDPFYAYAHRVSVFIPTRGEPTETEKQTLARIVEMSKPAHADARIEYVQPRFRIGIQAFIGVDTVVGEYPSGVTLGSGAGSDQGRLGYDTVLGPSGDEGQAPHMRIGKSTRIGSSTLID